jgi:hypothetical protein
LLPTTTMLSALSSLRPQPRMKARTLARWWCSKARASVHSRTVPVNLPQPPCCCHHAAGVALCTAAALRGAVTANDAATAAVPPPSFPRRCAVTLLPLPQHPQCCNRAAAIALFTATMLRATATTADAATAAVPPPSFCQRCTGALPPPPTSRCCAAATATDAATATAPPPSFRRRCAVALPPMPQPIGDSQLCRLRFKLAELQPCACWMTATLDHLEAHRFLQ